MGLPALARFRAVSAFAGPLGSLLGYFTYRLLKAPGDLAQADRERHEIRERELAEEIRELTQSHAATVRKVLDDHAGQVAELRAEVERLTRDLTNYQDHSGLADELVEKFEWAHHTS